MTELLWDPHDPAFRADLHDRLAFKVFPVPA